MHGISPTEILIVVVGTAFLVLGLPIALIIAVINKGANQRDEQSTRQIER